MYSCVPINNLNVTYVNKKNVSKQVCIYYVFSLINTTVPARKYMNGEIPSGYVRFVRKLFPIYYYRSI